jgi:hypothetical protein
MRNEKKDVNAAGNVERKKEWTEKEKIKQSLVINDNWILEWFLLSNLNARLHKIYAFKRRLIMFLSCRSTWIWDRVFEWVPFRFRTDERQTDIIKMHVFKWDVVALRQCGYKNFISPSWVSKNTVRWFLMELCIVSIHTHFTSTNNKLQCTH